MVAAKLATRLYANVVGTKITYSAASVQGIKDRIEILWQTSPGSVLVVHDGWGWTVEVSRSKEPITAYRGQHSRPRFPEWATDITKWAAAHVTKETE